MESHDVEFTAYFAARVAGLRRLGYALCGDWHTADDLVQATFLKLLRHWPRVRDGSVDAYTRRIMVNTYLSLRRDRQREEVVADVPDRAGALPVDEGHGDVAQVLAQLPARQRAVVVLRYLEDLPVRQVAELLGMAEGTVKSQASRGVEALRRALQPATGGE